MQIKVDSQLSHGNRLAVWTGRKISSDNELDFNAQIKCLFARDTLPVSRVFGRR